MSEQRKILEPISIDCEAAYCANFLAPTAAAALFDELVGGYDVTNNIMKMADGSEHIAETGVYLFTDSELTSFDAFPEAWGGRSEWPASLASVRDQIEELVGVRFPVARCVYYRDGSEGMDFHTDPPAYGPTDSIASLSLGAEREFILRSRSNEDETFRIMLASGSLLHMGKHCQERYEHGLPRSKDCVAPRLNLTFRKYGWDE